MCIGARALVKATIFPAALLVWNSVTYGQEPKPSPTSAPIESTTENVKSDGAAAAAKTASAEPAPAPEFDFWRRETMTGNWGGTRTAWKEKGVEIELKALQFVQGVAAGGIDTGAGGNGKCQPEFKFDLGNLVVWKFW